MSILLSCILNTSQTKDVYRSIHVLNTSQTKDVYPSVCILNTSKTKDVYPSICVLNTSLTKDVNPSIHVLNISQTKDVNPSICVLSTSPTKDVYHYSRSQDSCVHLCSLDQHTHVDTGALTLWGWVGLGPINPLISQWTLWIQHTWFTLIILSKHGA